MLKIFLIVVAIVGVGIIAYYQGVTDTSHQISEKSSAEKVGSEAPASPTSRKDVETAATEQVASNVLDLRGQGLTQTPAYVFEKTDTEKLDLSDNKLTGSLQAEIRHLQNLRVLNLSDNQFTGVPAEIGQLTKLEVLDLSNNRITGLPLELGNLSNLKVLNLKGNEYAHVDLERIREKLPASTEVQVD